MHARQEIVHAEVGHGKAEECQCHVYVVGCGATQQGQALSVERHGIEHERYERPRLLRVPAPVGSPAHVCPDGAYEYAYAQGGNGGMEEQKAQNLQLMVKAIGKLSKREQTIVRLRFGINMPDGREKTQKEVADLLGISQSYISRLEKRIMKRLKKEIVRYE